MGKHAPKPKTMALYQDFTKHYLVPNLGQIRLLELRAHHLDRDVRGDRARATWPPVSGGGLLGLRHLARGDPLLDLCPEVAPKGPG